MHLNGVRLDSAIAQLTLEYVSGGRYSVHFVPFRLGVHSIQIFFHGIAASANVSFPSVCSAGKVALPDKTCGCPIGTSPDENDSFQCKHCKLGTYKDADGAAPCHQCPVHATTRAEGATSARDCICEVSHFAFPSPGVDCRRCPTGADCVHTGATLLHLPLKRGHFRFANSSVDIRACPDVDATAKCSANYTSEPCNSAFSGCLGGSDVSDQCLAGLTGIYCTACANKSHYYSKGDSGTLPACKVCEFEGFTVDAVTSPAFLALLVCLMLIAGCLAAFKALTIRRPNFFLELQQRTIDRASTKVKVCQSKRCLQ